MKNRQLKLTPKHAKASVKLCNVLLFFVLGALISAVSSSFFTLAGSEARSAADDLNILSGKMRQQVLLIQLARFNAEFLADKTFRKGLYRDESAAKEAFARFGTTQALGFAIDMTYESSKLATRDSFFVFLHEPWLETLKNLSAEYYQLQTQISALLSNPAASSPDGVKDIYEDMGEAYLRFEKALSSYEKHLNEQQLANHRAASAIVWIVFFIQLIALAVASIYDALIERNRA